MYFHLSYKAHLMVINFFFCMENSLNPDNLAKQSILGCRFLPFSTFSIYQHSLLAYNIFAEKSADSAIGFPLQITFVFLLLLQRFSLSLTADILLYPLVQINLGSSCFELRAWPWMFISLPGLGKVSVNSFFSLFWDSFTVVFASCWRSLNISSFLKSSFLLFSLHAFHYPVFQIANTFFFLFG